MHRAAVLARRAAEQADLAGRSLAAANAELPWPNEDHLVLWHAATILREHRGNSHVAALITPLAAHITASAAGGPPRDHLQSFRQYSDEEWDAQLDVLRDRGGWPPRGV